MGLQARTHGAGDSGFLKNSYIYLQQVFFFLNPKTYKHKLNTLKPILDKVHLCAYRFSLVPCPRSIQHVKSVLPHETMRCTLSKATWVQLKGNWTPPQGWGNPDPTI